MSFLAAAIRSIREWAGEMEGWQAELDFVPLAAHLFAVGNQLLLNEGSARLLRRTVPPACVKDLEDLRLRLAAIPGSLTPSELYLEIRTALIMIESALVRIPSLAAALPPYTELRPFPPGQFRGLSGRVQHWIRPLSALSQLRSSRYALADPPPPRPWLHPGDDLERLVLYWDSDLQLPGVVRVPLAPWNIPFFFHSGEDSARHHRLRIALCPLEGPFHPRFSIDPEGRFFQALQKEAIAGSEALTAHLEAVIHASVADGVNLVLFPELTIDTATLDHLRRLLHEISKKPVPFYGVIAGSFHVWNAPLQPPVNEAVLLSQAGALLLAHRKRGWFRVLRSQVTGKFFPERPETVGPEIFEDIRYGSELRLLETPLGRLALLICADAIAADDRGYVSVVRRLRPDLLMVISMTPETQPFEAFAEEMSRYRIGTVFVNAHCICQRDDANLAAWDLALFEARGDPPTRSRWRLGQPEPECFYFKPADGGPKGWRPLSKAPSPTGISLLRQGEQTLGVVLDLGVHWRDESEKRK